MSTFTRPLLRTLLTAGCVLSGCQSVEDSAGGDAAVGASSQATYALDSTGTEPQDTNADGVVTLCLNEDSGDCDYPMTGNLDVKMSLRGAVTFPFPVVELLSSNTSVKLVEENGGPRQMVFAPFYYFLRINPANPKQVLWDVPPMLGMFTGNLFVPYKNVDMVITIRAALLRSTGTIIQTQVTLSSNGTNTPGLPALKKVRLVYQSSPGEQHTLLLIDRSSYMDLLQSDGSRRFDAAITQARNFVNTPSAASRYFSVGTFTGTTYTQEQGFSDIPTTLATLNALQVGMGLTPLAHALCIGVDALLTHKPGVSATKVLSLYSAGYEVRSPPSSPC
ncbi:MAG TPA: VWA domain-containing protein, partial [Archangium sp.]|nr:VWA domain-containing protein [Archangium sp.]